MYLEHFGLSEPPFRITPHTDFFFDGANRGATLDALIYAITHDEGIVKVSGEVGSGKTMLCRVLMERLPEHVTIIYLANPSLSREDILYAIADELRLNVPENARMSVVLRTLQDHLINSFSQGRRVVVLIDEAHAMPAETLEEIRLLSNLEANRSKLLQLVLFGQPELNDVLARPDMRQLKERITHNFGLEPLVRDDINTYLDFRMRAAGYRGPNVFSPVAVKMIAQTSLGLTRRINILADKALLAAFSSSSHEIGPREVKAAIRDCEFSDATYGGSKTRKLWIPAGATLVGVLVAAGIAWQMLSTPVTPAASMSAAPLAPANAPVVSPPPLPQPLVSEQTAAAPPVLEPATTSPVLTNPAAAQTPHEPAKAELSSVAINAASANAADENTDIKVGKLTRQHLKSGKAWLKNMPDDRWFLQVLARDETSHEEIEAFLKNAVTAKVEMSNIHVYYSKLSGKPKFGLIYGEYPSHAAATAAIRRLPSVLKIARPYPRQVVRLR